MAILAVVLVFSGCATSTPLAGNNRKFNFQTDTFAFANEVVWIYEVDPVSGRQVHHRKAEKPDYVLHCFVVARSARQFFQFAKFDPAQPKSDPVAYAKLIRKVVSRDPSRPLKETERIVFPGYSNLREFSSEHADLLRKECGGAWQSYFQRGNWRMVMPVSRAHQQRTAEALTQRLRSNQPAVAHVFCFPKLKINHAVVVFDVLETEKEILFPVYDPNMPEKPTELIYDRGTRSFSFPATFYFKGGAVNVYEIYRSLLY
jgi:hypothetical protein